MSSSLDVLATVHQFRVYVPEKPCTIRVHRVCWGDGDGWRAEATDQKGNLIDAKPITADYAADVLRRFADVAQVEHFSRWDAARDSFPYSN
jgi:hypothetical protein